MSWGIVAASVISAGAGAYSARQGAKAQQRGADASTAELARQYDQTREDLAPYRNTGGQALGALNRLFGFSTPGTEPTGGYFSPDLYLQQNPDVARDPFFSKHPEEHWERHGQFEGRQRPFIGETPGTPGTPAGAPDMSGFFASPDYNFRRTEGMRGIESSFAARGGAQSGNALRALTEFNSNLAAGEFGNYFNRLAGLAGVGQTATNQTAAYGQNTANNIAGNHLYAGNARASGIAGQYNALGQGLSDVAGIYGYYNRNRVPAGYGGTGYGGAMGGGIGGGVRVA